MKYQVLFSLNSLKNNKKIFKTVVCCIFVICAFDVSKKNASGKANRADPDQTAQKEAV